MLSVLLLWGAVSAQEIGAPPAPPASVESVAVEETPVESEESLRATLHKLEAASFYQVGLELVIQGAFSEAEAIFQQIIERYADTEYGGSAAEQKAALDLLSPEHGAQQRVGLGSPGESMTGVMELAVSQGLVMPVILGVLLPGATFQPEEPLAPVGLGMLGIGVGVAGAQLLNRVEPVDTQTAMAILSGELIGGLNGLAISAAWPPRSYRGLWTETLVGTLVGGGAAYAASRKFEITPGEIAAVNSGALWGTYFSLMSQAFVYSEDDRGLLLRTMAGLDMGALLGGGLGRLYRPSRGRVNVVTLSGIAGTAIGGGVSLLADYYGDGYLDDSAVAVIIGGGSVLGMGVGAYLSGRNQRSALTRAPTGLARLQIAPMIHPGENENERVLGLSIGATGW